MKFREENLRINWTVTVIYMSVVLETEDSSLNLDRAIRLANSSLSVLR